MSLCIIDAREWQRVFDLKTGRKADAKGKIADMVKDIIARHPFPGDVEMATNAWVTDSAIELIGQCDPQLAFISYGLPYFSCRFHDKTVMERREILASVFTEAERLVGATGFTPVIVGSGGLVPLKGYIDLSRLDGLAVASNWTAGYVGLHAASDRDLAYIQSLPEVERIATKKELTFLFNGKEEDAGRVPDYFVMAKEGYTYKSVGITLRRSVNVPAHNYFIPVSTNLGEIDTITGIRKLIEKHLPDKKIALIIIEGLGFEDFPFAYQRCINSVGWYCYEQGELQFFAMYMGRHNFFAYPQGYQYPREFGEDEPYPLSGYFRDIPSDTIGAQLGIRRISVGSRSMFPHATTGADISIECFARNLSNQGCMAVINEGI